MTTAMPKFNVISVVLILVVAVNAKLPPIIDTCPRNSPNPIECVLKSVEKIRPNLASGDFGPDFQVPKLEPLFIDQIGIDRGPDFKANFTEINVSGPSKFVIEEMKVADFNKLIFEFMIALPKLEFAAKYALRARLAIIDISGNGNVKGFFKNTRARVRVRGYTEPRNGKDYVRFRRIQVRINIPEAKFNLDNLFNGDPVLNQLGNRVVNENADIFLQELVPGLESSLSERFTDIVNEILKDATHDDMFPSS